MALYKITNDATGIEFETERESLARVLQNAHNLLMTSMGEVPFDRKRGLNTAIYDLPVTDAKAALLPELDRVMLWEPRANVQEADIEIRDDGTMRIICILNINSEEDENG